MDKPLPNKIAQSFEEQHDDAFLEAHLPTDLWDHIADALPEPRAEGHTVKSSFETQHDEAFLEAALPVGLWEGIEQQLQPLPEGHTVRDSFEAQAAPDVPHTVWQSVQEELELNSVWTNVDRALNQRTRLRYWREKAVQGSLLLLTLLWIRGCYWSPTATVEPLPTPVATQPVNDPLAHQPTTDTDHRPANTPTATTPTPPPPTPPVAEEREQAQPLPETNQLAMAQTHPAPAKRPLDRQKNATTATASETSTPAHDRSLPSNATTKEGDQASDWATPSSTSTDASTTDGARTSATAQNRLEEQPLPVAPNPATVFPDEPRRPSELPAQKEIFPLLDPVPWMALSPFAESSLPPAANDTEAVPTRPVVEELQLAVRSLPAPLHDAYSTLPGIILLPAPKSHPTTRWELGVQARLSSSLFWGEATAKAMEETSMTTTEVQTTAGVGFVAAWHCSLRDAWVFNVHPSVSHRQAFNGYTSEGRYYSSQLTHTHAEGALAYQRTLWRGALIPQLPMRWYGQLRYQLSHLTRGEELRNDERLETTREYTRWQHSVGAALGISHQFRHWVLDFGAQGTYGLSLVGNNQQPLSNSRLLQWGGYVGLRYAL